MIAITPEQSRKKVRILVGPHFLTIICTMTRSRVIAIATHVANIREGETMPTKKWGISLILINTTTSTFSLYLLSTQQQ